ncbi:MAG: GntR family transcriptional regulator [Synergistaceae bacterium]|jgi:DNA-binding GntR family transcriptional regulator|nr:GntR family transcriptional regulator [Synergistaceae bacterium]
MGSLEAITHLQSIGEVVYDKLKAAVMSDVFKRGERLVELDIATKLNVSRTPVRAALQRLEAEGLLESGAGQGFFVKEYSADDIREIYLIRQSLESLAAEYAARNATEADIESISGLIDEMESAYGNPDISQSEIFELHKKFSEAYHRASHMPTLVRLIASLNEQMTHFRRVSLNSAKRRALALDEHKGMMEAVRRREPELAAELTRVHIVNARNAYFMERPIHSQEPER